MIRIPVPDPDKPYVNWITYRDMEAPMSECPLCKSALPSDHPALTLAALDKAVKEMGGWDNFEGDDARWGKPVGSTFRVGARTAKVEAKKVSYNAGDLAEYASYYGSELPQGTTFETFVVIEIDGSYFKKTGTADSYGTISWDGDLKIVVPTEKTVKVFE